MMDESNLGVLRDFLDRSGLSDVLDTFGEACFSQEQGASVAALLPDKLHTVFALLCNGVLLETESVPVAVRSALLPLVVRGVLRDADGVLRSPALRLRRVQQLWYLAQLNSSPNPGIYFGHDSLALASRLPAHAARVLDLCCGPGLQGLIMASRGAEVLGVDANPAACASANLNAGINGLEGRYRATVSDLFESIDPAARFDLICMNPPLLPIPSGLGYPFIGDGGPDGLAVTRRVWGNWRADSAMGERSRRWA